MNNSAQIAGNAISVSLASLVVLCTFRKYPLQPFDYPVLAIALSDICYSAGSFVEDCYAAFILVSIGSTSTVLWTSALASLVYISARETSVLERFLKWYGAACLVLTAALIAIPGGIIGEQLIGTCWVSDSNAWKVTVNRFVTLYGPLLLTLAWCAYVYCTVRVNHSDKVLTTVFNCNRQRTQLYPLALLMSFGMMLVLRLLGIPRETRGATTGLAYDIAEILLALNGALNSLVFFLTDYRVGLGAVYSSLLN